MLNTVDLSDCKNNRPLYSRLSVRLWMCCRIILYTAPTTAVTTSLSWTLLYCFYYQIMVEFCNDKIQIFYLLAPPTQPHAEMNGMRFWNSDCRRWTQNRPKVELKYSVCPVWQLGPIITLLSHVKLVTSSPKFPILKFNTMNYITKLFSSTLSSVWKLIQTDIWANKVSQLSETHCAQ